jgi:hypothetical protein
MAEPVSNPFDFIARLPEATITAPFEKHPGIFVQAALIEGPGRNVFIEVIYGPNVPVVTYTVNVGGRGALVIAEQEFRDLVSSGLALFEIRSTGKDAPTSTSAALSGSAD